MTKKVKNTVPYIISDLNGKEIVGEFYEKELEKTNQTEFRVEKAIQGKNDKLSVKWKGYDNSFNSWIDKKISLYKMSYFREPFDYSLNKIRVELNLTNYATNSDLRKQQVLIHHNLLKRLI